MEKKRLVSLLLLLGIFATSCQNVGDNVTTTGESENDDTTTQETTSAYADGLPEVTFGGREFRILSQDEDYDAFDVDTANGSLMNDAFYKRNEKVMERFDIDITVTNGGN